MIKSSHRKALHPVEFFSLYYLSGFHYGHFSNLPSDQTGTRRIPMEMQSYTFKAKDGLEIVSFKWLPENPENARAVFSLVHGSLEYAGRYEHFIRFLTDAGFIVYAHDIRGHGKTAEKSGEFVYFSEQPNGWELAVEDVHTVTKQIQLDFPGLPVFIFGHSMGSMLVRDYISQHGSDLKGAIICGTGRATPLLMYSGLLVAKLFSLTGKKRESGFLHQLIYGELNKPIENPQTDFDFLSRDPVEVQKYIDDPWCGRMTRVEYALELVRGVIRINRAAAYENTPTTLPLFLISGEKDPVGGPDGQYVKEVAQAYEKAGVESVITRLYKGARHELVNETNRDEVMGDIAEWLNARLQA
jgi:alpha-beta hydrolase superfamily lysophospholipase